MVECEVGAIEEVGEAINLDWYSRDTLLYGQNTTQLLQVILIYSPYVWLYSNDF